jgi:hypothetical protein
MSEDVPFEQRAWCSTKQAQQYGNWGKTILFEKIKAGEILSKKEGTRRKLYVPSVIACAKAAAA